MTNETAIHRLLLVRHRKDCTELLAEALDMAIEALRRGLENVNEDSGSESPNRSDLINRQDAIDVLADYIRNVDRVYSTGLLSTTDCIDAARSVLDDLPSANTDLSGFCDRLWKGAYDRGYERCKQDAIDAVNETIAQYIPYLTRETNGIPLEVALAIKRLPSAQPVTGKFPDDLVSRQALIEFANNSTVGLDANDIARFPSAQPELYCAPQPDLSDDGTLMMTVPHGILSDVKRVMVDEVGTKFCKVMYQDEPEHDGWIPTKIAKPPKAGQYLVTKQQNTGVCQIATAYYNPSFDEWSGNGNFTKVLAWQQLPTPYTQE